MQRVLPGIIAAVLLGAPGEAHAQDRVRIEVVPGAVFSTETFADSDLGNGLGVGAHLSVPVLPHLAAYGGWNYHGFRAETSFAGPDVDVEETGYAFGVRFEHPMAGATSPALMLKAGGTYDHIEIENAAGDLIADSGHGFGWEAGAGVAFPLGDRWHITPGVRFRSLTRDIDVGAIRTPVTLRYVAAEIGFSRSF